MMQRARWERVHVDQDERPRNIPGNIGLESPEALRELADLLDSRFKVGGFRFGWDAIVGFVPVLGDLATNLVSLYIVFQAALLGAPGSVLLRMLGNVLVDNLLDAVPFLGNFADFVWRSNNRNVRLLDAWLSDPRRTVRRSRLVIGVTMAAAVACVLGLAALAVTVAVALFGWLASPKAW